MNPTAILKTDLFDLSQINYSDIKVLDSGAKQVYMNYGCDNDRIILHTPRFSLPFNMNVFNNGETIKKYSLDASFRDMDNYQPLRNFYDRFSELDKKLINDGIKNSMPWFKKRRTTREVVEALYYPLIKKSKDKDTGELNDKYPPTIRFKLPCRNGRFMFEVFDFNRNPIDLNIVPLADVLVKGAKIRALIQCSGLWFASGRFGCTWNIVQLRVKVPARLQEYAFLPDSDDEESNGDDKDSSTDAQIPGTHFVNSEDDSGDDVELVHPVKVEKS